MSVSDSSSTNGTTVKSSDKINMAIVQINMADEMSEKLEHYHEVYEKFRDVAHLEIDEYQKKKSELLEEFDKFHERSEKAYKALNNEVDNKTNQFRKELTTTLGLFQTLKLKLNKGRNMAASQDNLYETIVETSDKWSGLVKNMNELQSLQERRCPQRSQSNDSIGSPKTKEGQRLRPLETELASHISKVIKELIEMRNTLHTGEIITGYMDEIIKHSFHVARVTTMEFAPHSMQDYLETLPASCRSTTK